jgi:hypothetical protein
MKRAFTTAGLFLGLLATTATAQAAKPKVLVQDLVAQGVEPSDAAVMSSAACQAFAKNAAYDVLCGEDIRNMMRFGALTAAFDGCADEKCYEGLGKATKARYVVSGSVSKLGGTFILSLSVFDTEQARPIGRTEVKAESLEKLHGQVPEAVSATAKRS